MLTGWPQENLRCEARKYTKRKKKVFKSTTHYGFLFLVIIRSEWAVLFIFRVIVKKLNSFWANSGGGGGEATNICQQISMLRSKQQFVKNTNPISAVVHLRVSPPCRERNTIKFRRWDAWLPYPCGEDLTSSSIITTGASPACHLNALIEFPK